MRIPSQHSRLMWKLYFRTDYSLKEVKDEVARRTGREYDLSIVYQYTTKRAHFGLRFSEFKTLDEDDRLRMLFSIETRLAELDQTYTWLAEQTNISDTQLLRILKGQLPEQKTKSIRTICDILHVPYVPTVAECEAARISTALKQLERGGKARISEISGIDARKISAYALCRYAPSEEERAKLLGLLG